MATAKKKATSNGKFYLYKVSLSQGRSNPNFALWLANVNAQGARSGSHGGIDSICLIAHRQDADIVAMLCSAGMATDKERAGVVAIEITEQTLAAHQEDSHFEDIVNDYFRKNFKFHNIKSKQPNSP